MLDPSIAMHDLDGCGFDLLNALAERRQVNSVHELQVLHESGRVLAVVDSRVGSLIGPHPPVVDPAAAVIYWRTRTGAERVLLADADTFRYLARLEANCAGTDCSQAELFTRLTAAFWTAEGVVADPPVDPTDWAPLAKALAELGPAVVRLVVMRGDGAAVDVFGRLRAGRLVELAGTPAAGVPCAASEKRLTVRLDWSEFEELMLSPDFPGKAAALLEKVD